MKNKQCFVIQPFDKDKYDKRYHEIYKPSIENAGLIPYRVDADKGSRVLIESIENEISESLICFADITEDNPNVWYELGYAYAKGKDVVMVCEDKRESFPFDIRHKRIIKYSNKSKSDFQILEKDITETLIEYLKKPISIQVSQNHQQSNQDNFNLNEIDKKILGLLKMNMIKNKTDDYPEKDLKEELFKCEYNLIEIDVSLNHLTKIGLIVKYKYANYYTTFYHGYLLTLKGKSWVLNNL